MYCLLMCTFAVFKIPCSFFRLCRLIEPNHFVNSNVYCSKLSLKMISQNRVGIFSFDLFQFSGLAKLSSTCSKQFGESVNNDIGLATALIVAHETAHT